MILVLRYKQNIHRGFERDETPYSSHYIHHQVPPYQSVLSNHFNQTLNHRDFRLFPSTKIPVQVPAIETCFMSTDEILVARILSKSRSLYIRGEFNVKKFFQVPWPRGKLEIFPSSRALEEARNFSKFQEYEEIWRKYEDIMKDIWRNMKEYEGTMEDIWRNKWKIWK